MAITALGLHGQLARKVATVGYKIELATVLILLHGMVDMTVKDWESHMKRGSV